MRSAAVALVALLLLASPLVAEEATEVRPHLDEQLEEHEVFEKLEEGLASDDIDDRIAAVRSFGRWRHKSVLKQLKKIWTRNKDYELKAAAAEGLGQQTPFVKQAGKVLVQQLTRMMKIASREDPKGEDALKQTVEAKALVAGIRAVGELGYRDGWKAMSKFIDHHHDEVAGEMMLMCGRLKEYRALPLLLEWFNFYPDGYSYEGGSVRVDTGAAGNKDAKAAKAKWMAKYGGKKRKARPKAFIHLLQALEMITGEKFEKAEELKAWMKENELLLKKHGV